VRFFRIPAFTGIETHRDDMDRGSLRIVEGCIPHGPGGLRSSPVWSTLGTVSQVSTDDQNKASAIDDSSGTSLLFASRNNEVHDVAMIHAANSVTLSLGHHDYDVINQALFTDAKAYYAPVGNKLYAFGDGSDTAVMVGKGPRFKGSQASNRGPDKVLYTQEWSDFPQCQFFVAGPMKTIFASGNPRDPLAIYISEPAGQMQPFRNAPHSTESSTESPGLVSDSIYHPLEQTVGGTADGMSTVRIIGSNATRVTALSTRGDKIVVHTDAGCHILYAPSADQASTGYRVEQVAATNTSSAVNSQVVAGDGGTQPFWFGFDGQIYKDEAAVRGAEDFKSYSDPQQASWKAKGKWEREHPNNLENSFATYDPQSGMYWVFVESSESALSVRSLPLYGPAGLTVLAPTSGPTDLVAAVGPVSGPTGLAAVTIPISGPTGLTVLAPTSGPTGLTSTQPSAPVSGPTGLSPTQLTIPISGPTGLTVLAPTSGPTGLSPTQLPAPVSGPTGLTVLAPTSGPTAFSAVQPFNAQFPHLWYLIPGSPNYAGDRMYATGLNRDIYGNYLVNNFGYQSFNNVSTPTSTAALPGTASSGSTCNVPMSMYFPGSGSRHFLRSNSVCSFYQHWIRMTYAGLLDLDAYAASANPGIGGNWNAGTGPPAWHYQEINGTTGGVWDVWIAAGNTTGIYYVVKRLGTASSPFVWARANAVAGQPMGSGPYALVGGTGTYLEMFASSGPGNHDFTTSENRYFDQNSTFGTPPANYYLLPV
jgi:hypothetical protein